MKTFGNIQQLWDYCEFCPLCQESCRQVWAMAGPDPSFDLIAAPKEGDILTLQCQYKGQMGKWAVDYKINCQNNTFDVVAPWTDYPPTIQEIRNAYFYLWIQGECGKCGNTYVASQDIELDSFDSIGLETETIHLLDDKLQLVLLYEDDIMQIIQRSFDSDEVYLSVDNSMDLPLVELDWKDQQHAIERLKTFLLFG